jgi:prepilin-type N-terminal cleavage/methylation domain-containing protein
MRYASNRFRAPSGGVGFTLIELMIVVALIAIIAAIAIPNLLAARLNANETAAVANLRTLSTAQSQFQMSGKCDEDRDGMGEYGYFGELGGRVAPRLDPIRPPAELTQSLAQVNADGEVNRGGYHLRLYLPLSTGAGQREQANGGIPVGTVDPDLCENVWACYAWPTNFNTSGTRTFFVNQKNAVVHTTDSTYTGGNCAAILAGNAFISASTANITAMVAVGTTAADGNLWRQVQ